MSKETITKALKAFTDPQTLTSVAARGLYEALGVTMKEGIRLDQAIDMNETMYCKATTTDRMPKALAEAFSHVINTYLVGSIDSETMSLDTIDDSTKDMLFFAVDTDRQLTRTDAANLARLFNRMARRNPVALIIRCDATIDLALCERTNYVQQWRPGQKIGRVRIMQHIDCADPHRGHVDMLDTIAQRQYTTHDEVYNHWLDVFSVQNLTKRFYQELQDWYFRAVRVALFPNDTTRTDDYQAHNAEAIIRFITRFIFVWFLKHKGLVNDDLFSEEKLTGILRNFDPQATDDGTYYNAILQNLFFGTLNRKVSERRFIASYQGRSPQHEVKTFYRGLNLFNPELKEEDIIGLFRQTPYVNGSLFDCLDNRTVGNATISYDGFSNTRADRQGIIKQALMPNSLFFAPDDTTDTADLSAEYGAAHTVKAVGLLTIFRRYYFTVEENTPLDEQVALDPELLGRVFENLLGTYNPETNESSRNATGSFYTPREIVEYMTDESLRAYLTAKCPQCTATIDALLDGNDEAINTQDAEPLMRAIYNCRILDPACGSGAFPMGLLQRLVDCLRLLDTDNKAWRTIVEDEATRATGQTYHNQQLTKEQREERLREIAANFERSTANTDFARKLYIIQRSIHGVDIQNIAIMISKLRFFISLLCEQQPNNDPNDNYGILTLPNLETNLVCANSLIIVKRLQKGDFYGSLFEDPRIKETKEQLFRTRAEYFNAKTTRQKRSLQERDQQLRQQLLTLLEENKEYAPDDAHQLAQWDPYDQVATTPFFDSEWMFGITDGFDIVIGNPPYISAPMQLSDNALKEQRTALAKSGDYATLFQKWDLYIPFMERGLRLLSKGGSFSMIVPFPLSNQLYAKTFRRWVLEHYDVWQIADLNGTKVFERATVSNLILFAAARKGTGATQIAHITGEGKISVDFAQEHSRMVQDDKNGVWNFTKEERKSTRHEGMHTLGDFCYISIGLVLNADEKKNKGGFTKDVLISDTQDDIHCRKYIEGKDLERYRIKRVRYLEWGTKRCPGEIRRPTFPELYERKKLLINALGEMKASIDTEGDFVCDQKVRMALLWRDLRGVDNKSITSSVKRYSRLTRAQMEELSEQVSLEYLLGIMNSRYAASLLAAQRGGDINIGPEHIRAIPIPLASPAVQSRLSSLVRQILTLKQRGEDTSALEHEIDLQVCDLYGLTAEERAAIGLAETE